MTLLNTDIGDKNNILFSVLDESNEEKTISVYDLNSLLPLIEINQAEEAQSQLTEYLGQKLNFKIQRIIKRGNDEIERSYYSIKEIANVSIDLRPETKKQKERYIDDKNDKVEGMENKKKNDLKIDNKEKTWQSKQMLKK